MRKTIVTSWLLAVMIAMTATAQVDSTYEQVLIPFDTTTIPGASGALWSAELRVRNGGQTPVNLFPERCFFIGREFPCERRIDIAAQAVVLIDAVPYTAPDQPGVLLYVPTNREADIQFDLRVRDLSKGADPVGTPVPVVRSRNYRRGQTVLINVPLGPEVRSSFRVYTPDLSGAVFRVKVLDEANGDLVVAREYSRVFPTDPPYPAWLPATFDFSEVLRFAAAAGARGVSVVVERTFPPDQPYWPMISITNNSTHKVVVLTPN